MRVCVCVKERKKEGKPTIVPTDDVDDDDGGDDVDEEDGAGADWYWYDDVLLADVDGPLLQMSDVGDFFRRSYGDWWFVEVAVGDVLIFGITGLFGFGAAAASLKWKIIE